MGACERKPILLGKPPLIMPIQTLKAPMPDYTAWLGLADVHGSDWSVHCLGSTLGCTCSDTELYTNATLHGQQIYVFT
jgi:hypothetical protein